jgi:hypothetical protein
VTLASEYIFTAFFGDEKGQALLMYGHLYSAHPVGCVSAIHALEAYDTVVEKQNDRIRNSLDLDRVRSMSFQPIGARPVVASLLPWMLVKAYNHLKEEYPSHGLGIVFISSDRSETKFIEYFASMPWMALPYGCESSNMHALRHSKTPRTRYPGLVVRKYCRLC